MMVVAFALLVGAGVCFFARLVVGPTLADRVIALDGLIVALVSGMVIDAARTGSPLFIDAIVVMALVGFVGTSAAALFIEERGG